MRILFYKQNMFLIDIILIRLKELMFSVDNCIVYNLIKQQSVNYRHTCTCILQVIIQLSPSIGLTLHKSSLYKTGPG